MAHTHHTPIPTSYPYPTSIKLEASSSIQAMQPATISDITMSSLISSRLVASRLRPYFSSALVLNGAHRNEKSIKDWRYAAVCSPTSQLSLSPSFRAFHSNTPILLAQREQRYRHSQHTRRVDGKHYNRDNNNLSKIQEHLHNFPTTKNSTALAAWHRTAVELVMDVSKLWGRHRQSNPSSPQQLYRAVLLANDLVSKMLSIRENELDEEDNTASRSIQRDKNEPRYRNTARKLSTELLAQTVALGFSRCDPKISFDGAYKAQELIDRLEEINIKHKRLKNKRNLSFNEEDVFPTNRIYNHVLNCWSRSKDNDAERHATELLSRMTSPRKGGVAFPRADIFSYNNMLNLYASRGNVSAAEDLLKKLEQSENGVTADVYSYTIVMNAMQRRFLSGNGDRYMKDPQRAEELLARLVRKYEESGFTNGKLCPTSVTFGTVLSMYAAADRLRKENLSMNQSRSWLTRNVEASTQRIVSDVEYLGWGAENAERVLEWIIGLSDRERRSRGIDSADENRHRARSEHDMFIRPCVQHFVTTCHAWANSGKGIEGAERCESLKNRNISLYKSTGYAELRPNVLLFGVVIDAWAKANEEVESAEHAEGLLDEAEKLFLHTHSSNPKERLSNIVYNQVIDAWSRRSSQNHEVGTMAGNRAENVLRRMMDNSRNTGNEHMRPDVISYTGVIKAYIDSPVGGEKALELLDEMNNEYMNGNRGAKPDTKAKSVVIDACIKSGLSTEALQLFSGIDDSEKSIVMFNTILTAYKNEGRCYEAESILRNMIALSEEGHRHCSPNTLSYYLCIVALSKSKAEDRVARARVLFNETIQRYRGGDSSCEPSVDLFNALAVVISHSEMPCRENEVLTLLEEMEANGCKPTLESFNILIHTCSRAEESNMRNALQIAASAYNALDAAGLTADSVTYMSMIRVILNLMNDSEGRVQALSALFRKCCEGGFLNQHMINILAQNTSEDEFQSITGMSWPGGIDALQIESLPFEWRQNATSQRKN